MPRLVNYSDRFDAVREAVYVLTLRDGAEAISLPAVAAELDLSPRSLQRLVASTRHLPLLGLQWAEREQRYRRINGPRSRVTDPCRIAVTALVESVPGAPTEPDDVRVWWALVATFEGTCDWAREARAEHHLLVETLVASVVDLAELDETPARYERERLCALVDGTGRRILDGRLAYEDGIALIDRHLRDVLPALQDASGDAA